MQANSKRQDGEQIGKQEQCYAVIRQRISDGTYGPSHRLVLGELAEELNMSQVPVREAIRRLEAEGLVMYRRNIGAQVTPMTEELLYDLMQVQAVLESSATALAARSISAKTISQLYHLIILMESALQRFDFHEYLNQNVRFHEAIVETCPNVYLIELWRSTTERVNTLRGLILSRVPERAIEAIQEHKKLLRLIEEKARPDTIERFARSHVEKTFQRFFTMRKPSNRHPAES
jgi:DNA-binding GntR family transcriptional regulator